MNRLIGRDKSVPFRKPKTPPPDLDGCISKVDGRADEIDKKVLQCESDLKKIREQMKKMLDGSAAKNELKQRALRILQRKKKYEVDRENLRAQSFNMEQATMGLQMAKDTQNILAATKTGIKQMKKEYKKIDIDEIDDLHAQMSEIFESADGIQEALGRPTTNYNIPDLNDDELRAELEALGEEVLADNDSSYLDQAVPGATTGSGPTTDKNPEIPAPSTISTNNKPETVPAATNLPNRPSNITPEGIEVDQYGLPKLPAESFNSN